MSARAASSALILSLMIAPGFFRPAQAGPWLPAPGEYYTELRGGLFTAKSYRNDDGDRVSLGGKWEERSLLGTVELGWKKRLSVVMAAPFTSATRLDAVGSTTSTGLEDFRFGLRVGLLQGPTALAAELDWQTPLGYNRESSLFARPPRGDGLQQASLSLLFGRPLAGRGFLQLGTGVGYRYLSSTPEGGGNAADVRSTPFLASADIGMWLTPSLLACARYSGTVTLSHGALAPERTLHLAGPALVWRVDDRLDLTAGSWSSAMARNTLHYDQAYVALTFKQTKLNWLQGFLGGTGPASLMNGKFAMSAMGGGFIPVGDLSDEVNSGLHAGVGADYSFAPRLALGADALWFRITPTENSLESGSVWSLGGHGKYFFSNADAELRPYAVVGAGGYGSGGKSTGIYFGLNGGLGVLYGLTPEVSVGVQGVVHDVFDEFGSAQMFTLGVLVNFAGLAAK